MLSLCQTLIRDSVVSSAIISTRCAYIRTFNRLSQLNTQSHMTHTFPHVQKPKIDVWQKHSKQAFCRTLLESGTHQNDTTDGLNGLKATFYQLTLMKLVTQHTARVRSASHVFVCFPLFQKPNDALLFQVFQDRWRSLASFTPPPPASPPSHSHWSVMSKPQVLFVLPFRSSPPLFAPHSLSLSISCYTDLYQKVSNSSRILQV